ncbi:MAG: OmpA family protein [Acidobacteriota bacterium]|nr:MAG: OmpA family protein [Acidobacteriota bacterium]
MGCTAKKKWETGLADVNTRVDGIQSTVEQQGEEIDGLRSMGDKLGRDVQGAASTATKAESTAGQALSRANEAYDRAAGKVLWKTMLTNRECVFDLDRTEIKPDGARALEGLVSRITGLGKLVFIEIQGHTDATGNPAYNKALGLKRAEAVRDFLHEKGVPLNLMSVISYGESRPIADNSTRAGRSANRRVEVLVLE